MMRIRSFASPNLPRLVLREISLLPLNSLAPSEGRLPADLMILAPSPPPDGLRIVLASRFEAF